jgi:hypothetical protein
VSGHDIKLLLKQLEHPPAGCHGRALAVDGHIRGEVVVVLVALV